MDLRSRTAIPLILSIPLLAIAAVAGAVGNQSLLFILLAIVAILIAIAVYGTETLFLRPMQTIKQAINDLFRITGANDGIAPVTAGLPGVAADLAAMLERVKALDVRLNNESSQRHELEHALHEIRERYVLAVDRANDGLWEWDLKNNAVEFSPRWKGMLGYLDSDIDHLDDWKKLVHPMDLDNVMLRLENHLDELTPYFSSEYRVLHRDGRYRWINSRGTAIRHANGRPYRIVVMDNDVHARKEMEDTLIQAAEGLSSVSGEDFFRTLMKSLSVLLGTRDNLLCHVVGDPPTRARMLVYLVNGKFEQNEEYELEGTSCGAVIARREIVYVPHDVCEMWPVEKQYDRDSYLGVPLFDSSGRIIGHFACMDGKPMRQDLPHLAIFKIFAVRAAAELERMLLKQQLRLN